MFLVNELNFFGDKYVLIEIQASQLENNDFLILKLSSGLRRLPTKFTWETVGKPGQTFQYVEYNEYVDHVVRQGITFHMFTSFFMSTQYMTYRRINHDTV